MDDPSMIAALPCPALPCRLAWFRPRMRRAASHRKTSSVHQLHDSLLLPYLMFSRVHLP